MINNLLASTSMNAVDIVLLIILGICALSGLVKGFSKMFVKFLGGIVSLVVAVALCSKCAEFLNQQFHLIDLLSNFADSAMSKIFPEEVLSMTLAQLQSDGTAALSGPTFILNLLVGLVDKGIDPTTTVAAAVAPTCAYYLSIALGFIICYVICKIIFAIVGAILNKLVKLAMLGVIDKVLGLLLGAIKGFITCYVLVIIANLLPIPQLTELMSTSSLVKVITSVDLVGLLFSGINPSKYINDFINSVK